MREQERQWFHLGRRLAYERNYPSIEPTPLLIAMAAHLPPYFPAGSIPFSWDCTAPVDLDLGAASWG